MLYVVCCRLSMYLYFSFFIKHSSRTSFLTCPKRPKKQFIKMQQTNKQQFNAQRRRRGEEELVEGADGGVCRAIGGRHKDWLKPGRRGS